MPDHDAVDGLAVLGIDAIRNERKAHHVVTKAYGEHGVAKKFRRVVPIDDLVSALHHDATTSISYFHIFSPSQTRAGCSLPHPMPEHPLVALTSFGDLFVRVKDLLVEAIAVGTASSASSFKWAKASNRWTSGALQNLSLHSFNIDFDEIARF